MKDVRYSICATHFNNYEYLPESVGVFSELIEGRDDWELVITDAGSTDGSLSWLNELADSQENIRVIVEEGINIGEGRELAYRASHGDLLIQVMDLDADYHRDGRILEIMDWYEKLLAESEKDLMLSGGVLFCTRDLMDDLGGWLPLPTNEETELRHRALNRGRLRFCPFDVFGQNYGTEKSLLEAAERFYDNSAAKLQLGVDPWYLLAHWLRWAPGLRPKIGAIILLPVAWYRARKSPLTLPSTYGKFDPYILDFRKALYADHPELWLDPPTHLARYLDETEMNHLEGSR